MKRFLTLILSFLLLFGLVGTVGYAATSSLKPEANIGLVNLAYAGEKTKLAFTIEEKHMVSGWSLGLAVWYDGKRLDARADNTDFINFTPKTDEGGRVYYTTPPVTDSVTSMLVAPIVNTGSELKIAGKFLSYSVLDYAIARLDDEGVSNTQLESYHAIIDSSDISRSDYALITVDCASGTAGGICEGLLTAKSGAKLKLRANTKTADGRYFLYWQMDEERIDTRLATVTAAAGKHTLTAVFGDKEDSPYKHTYDFEAHETGEMAVDYPKDFDPYTFFPVNYKNRGWRWTLSGTELGIKFSNSYAAKDQFAPFVENMIYASDSHSIAEDENGNKKLHIKKNQSTNGAADKILSPVPEGVVADAIEADINLAITNTSASMRLNILYDKLRDGEVVDSSYIQMTPLFTADTVHIYIESTEAHPDYVGMKTDKASYHVGESGPITFRYELTTVPVTKIVTSEDGTETEITKNYLGVNVYFDGVLATTTPLVTNKLIEDGDVISLSDAQIAMFVNFKGVLEIDNITFFEREEN